MVDFCRNELKVNTTEEDKENKKPVYYLVQSQEEFNKSVDNGTFDINKLSTFDPQSSKQIKLVPNKDGKYYCCCTPGKCIERDVNNLNTEYDITDNKPSTTYSQNNQNQGDNSLKNTMKTCGDIYLIQMKEPDKDNNFWRAILKKKVEIPSSASSKIKSGSDKDDSVTECKRENCFHKLPESVCLYDEPCKASCFNAPPGIKPHKYPNGYPN